MKKKKMAMRSFRMSNKSMEQLDEITTELEMSATELIRLLLKIAYKQHKKEYPTKCFSDLREILESVQDEYNPIEYKQHLISLYEERIKEIEWDLEEGDYEE